MVDVGLRFRWIGTPCVYVDGAEVRLPVKKTLALLVRLSLGGAASRRELADLLWRDLDEATGRRNLRRALHRLRAAGLADAFDADEDEVRPRRAASDVESFSRAVAEGRLEDACRIEDGALCAGFVLDDEGPEFDAWLTSQREHHATERRGAFERRAIELEARSDFRGALALQRRLLGDDPTREATYRELMRLHDALGEREVALGLYERCERMLRDELCLEPLPQTRLLAERIRGNLGDAPVRERAPAPAEVARTVPKLEGRRVPFVARERELASIEAAAESVVLVEGDAGVGKTRLAVESAVRRVRARADGNAAARSQAGSDPAAPRVVVAVVRFSEAASAVPFRAIAGALVDFDARGLLAPLDAAARSALSPLVPAWRPAGGAPIADDVPPAVRRTRLIAACADALVCAAGPAGVLVFDDLHWADASSVELFGEMAARRHRAAGNAPGPALRIVATARPAELNDRAPVLEQLAALERRGDLARVQVAPFDEWSMLQLVQQLSDSAGGARFAARLVAATGGNAFFALETMRALVEAGEVRIEPGQGWSTRYDATTVDYAELPLPKSVIAAVRTRIAGLGETAQRVLETAALADDGSSLGELREATALTEWEALAGIERALAANVVERVGGGYRFAHDLFRSALRAGLSPERQALIHGRLAAALEPLAAAPARVARHWELAGRAEPACRAWIRAAEAAAAVHAHREAVDHYGRAAELAASDEERFELRDLRLVRMITSSWDAERDAELARMFTLAESTGSGPLMFRALLRASVSAANDRRPLDCERFALRALREFEPPDARRHLDALIVVAHAVGEQMGRGEDALARWRQALEVAERRDPRAIANAAARAAATAVEIARLDEAEALRRKALGALEMQETTPLLDRPQVLSHCSFVPRARGDRAAALTEGAQALALARRLRLASMEAMYLANQCETLADDGRLDEARAARLECMATLGDPTSPFACFVAAMIAVPLHVLAGELGNAVAAARAAVTAADALGGAGDRRESRFLLAGLLQRIGVAHEPARWVDEALAAETLPTGVLLLPAEMVRASIELETGSAPEVASARLAAALARPIADRIVHPHIASARVLRGRCELALGRADAARECVRDLRYSVAAEAEALAVRVRANTLDGARDGSADEAAAFVERPGVAPESRLLLMRALHQHAGSPRRAAAWSEPLRRTAQTLADSLGGEPALQGAFIRRHRDLLT